MEGGFINYGPLAKSSLLYIFVNKNLLEPTSMNVYSFIYVMSSPL
jgi:hypothetical protein